MTLPLLLVTLRRLREGETELRKRPRDGRLAGEIIVDQQSEIDAMNFWLSKKH
jgi:uncharacterized protein (DUF305 family)